MLAVAVCLDIFNLKFDARFPQFVLNPQHGRAASLHVVRWRFDLYQFADKTDDRIAACLKILKSFVRRHLFSKDLVQRFAHAVAGNRQAAFGNA